MRSRTVTIYRLVVLRKKTGDKEIAVREPAPDSVRIPVLMSGGFGAEVYSWDRKETTVAGLPVYR